MYSIFLVDDEELELEMIRDYIRWEEMGYMSPEQP